jgi:enterochelin esterase-like enzyme
VIEPVFLKVCENGFLMKIVIEQKIIASRYLRRNVLFDVYLPKDTTVSNLSLLLVNDGQNLKEMGFSSLLYQLISSGQLKELVCVGIHAGKDRKNEYGTARMPDYEGRGAKAMDYNHFILEELLPFIHITYGIEQFKQKGIAGFSLGGLSAIDLVWNHPHVFTIAGVFSGSLWWRTKSLDEDYNDDTDRIMHQQIRNGAYNHGLKFFFTTGSLDETADRNNNGIIDSIDDTLSLIDELANSGYDREHDIKYINYPDGKHDVATWGKAMPVFLLWGWGNSFIDINK